MTVSEVADLLQKSPRWVWDHLPDLPAMRIGRELRFRSSEIADWLDSQRIARRQHADEWLLSQGLHRLGQIVDGLPNSEELEELLSEIIDEKRGADGEG